MTPRRSPRSPRPSRRSPVHVLVAWTLAGSLVGVPPVQADNPAVTVNVDANANRRPINPLIYGVAYGDATTLPALNAPLNRNGGNNTSRYNWQQNTDNRGSDWYFESIAEPSATAGERGDTFIATARAANAEPMLTIPMVGWVGKVDSGRNKLASFSIAKYGAQTGSDFQWFPDAGNGVRTNGTNVTGNDPNDANVPADGAFQQGWMQHLTTRWGMAGSGGLRYYILDNEPSIWHSTHRDVHPTGANMDEMRDKIIDYASRVKSNDPGALVAAPEEWGWTGYLYSGYDQQWGSQHGWSNLPDRNNHGGKDYLPWLLDQLKQHDAVTGQRLLDVFTVHYYPQGGEFGNDVSNAMKLRRNRSTRSLWDPNYVDETWIADKVRLIPRIREWAATYYPGTKTGITEYNWGAEGDMNGATAQADVYGIFGREGLDVGARWTTPEPTTPTYKAMKLYRNYDGNRSGFGDTSVSASAPNPDELASFASVRSSDGALTVMIVGKSLSGNTPLTVNLANFSAAGNAQVWQLASNVLQRVGDVTVTANRFTASIPPQSVTLFVVPAQSLPTLSIGDASLSEGASGTTQAVFTVSLSAASSQTVTASWATADGTATTAGNDFVAASGALSFAPGVTSRTVSVTVNGDTAVEPDETFFVNLSTPANASIADGQGRGTITNDDTSAVPILAVSATTVTPGQAVQVTVQNGPGNRLDWVGMHATSGLDTALLDWKYLSNTRTAPATGLATATLTFAAPSAPGTYEFRFFQNNTYTKLATSPTVTVSGSSGASLAVTPTTASPGQTVQVTVSGGPGMPRDWVALHAQSAPDTGYLDWKYLNGSRTPPATGLTGGTLSFVLPQTAGTYNFRFFRDSTYSKLATSPTVTVASSSAPTLTVSSSSVTVGQTVQVTVANGPGNATDWLSVAQQGAADMSSLEWKYLNGTRTAPGTGMTGATVAFTMPQTPGTYEFRLFRSNTYTKLATSPAVTVTVGVTPTVGVSATTVARGGSLQVTVTNGPGNTTDWIGLHAAGAADTAAQDWKYLNGSRTAPTAGMTVATVTFTMPQTPGTYEFRLFRSNGYIKLATSPTVTVQ